MKHTKSEFKVVELVEGECLLVDNILYRITAGTMMVMPDRVVYIDGSVETVDNIQTNRVFCLKTFKYLESLG